MNDIPGGDKLKFTPHTIVTVSRKQATGRVVRIPSIEQIEERFGPTSTWEGRCAEVAACVEKMIMTSKRVRGHYLGTITGKRWQNRPTQHEWLELDDGSVIDPTRWSFEGKKPYVFYGRPPKDPTQCTGEEWPYDFAGMRLRRQGVTPTECPAPNTKEASLSVMSLSGEARKILFDLGVKPFGRYVYLSQLFWIANLMPQQLDPFTGEIYRWLIRNNYKSLIPIDLRRRYAP